MLNNIMKEINKDIIKTSKAIQKGLKERNIFLLRTKTHYSFDKPVFSVDGDVFSRQELEFKYKLNEEEVKRYLELREQNKEINLSWDKLKEDILKRNK